MIELLHIDCMDYMKGVPDKYFELAIVDPPFFKGVANKDYFNSRVKNTRKENLGNKQIWDNGIPKNDYFKQLVRVSKNQIIWGINYFNTFIGVPVGRIIWDKINDNTPFSDAEIASNSLIESVRIFRHKWNGMIQHDMKNKEERIHPTQKPVKLYKWLLHNYAKPGDKILDTHGGSMSIAIACHQMGFDLTLCEIDKDYYDAGVKRFKEQTLQGDLFK